MSWATAHKALVAAAARWLPEPEPTAVLGIDETRFGSVRWLLDGITWRRSDPWMTSFVDCTPGHLGALLGLAPGRTGGCVRDWLDAQSDAFRRRIEIVLIDPSAPYASGIRAAFPGVKIAIDKWHLVALANTMVTEVRQRVTRSLLGRRGTIWVNRRLLLTGAKPSLPTAKYWAVEVKPVAGLDAVEQLTRYVELLNRDPLLAAVGGILAAQTIKPQARTLAEDRGLRCVALDYDALRGMDPTTPRLF